MGQLRTQNLQQQQAQLGITQAQLQMKSNQAMMDAFVKGDGDYDKTDQAMRETPGILPNDYLAYQQHATTIATNRANLTKEQQAIQDHNNEQWSSILNPEGGIKSQDDWNAAIKTGVNRGLKVPDELTTPQGGIIPFTTPDHAKAVAVSLLLPSQISTQKLQASEAARAGAEAGKATAEGNLATVNTQLAQHKIDLYNTLQQNPQALAQRVAATVNPAKYPTLYAIALNEAKNQPDIDKINESVQKWGEKVANIEQEMDPGLRRAKIEDAITKETDPRVINATLAKSPELNLGYQGLGGGPNAPGGPGSITPSQLHGEAYLQSLQPLDAAQVKAVAEGRQTLDDAAGRNQVARQQLGRAVLQYDPSWSTQRAALRSAYTVGLEATNISNLNTAVVHSQGFLDAAQAMKAGSFQPKNRAYNWFRETFGSDIPTNFESIKTAWAGEMASALKGTATDEEIAAFRKSIDKIASPEQFEGAVNEYLKVLGQKLNTKHEQAQKTGVGDWSPILPSAREVFRQHGMDPTREDPTKAGGGRGGTGLQYVRTSTGANGHKIGQTADGKWHDVQTGAVIQ